MEFITVENPLNINENFIFLYSFYYVCSVIPCLVFSESNLLGFKITHVTCLVAVVQSM